MLSALSLPLKDRREFARTLPSGFGTLSEVNQLFERCRQRRDEVKALARQLPFWSRKRRKARRIVARANAHLDAIEWVRIPIISDEGMNKGLENAKAVWFQMAVLESTNRARAAAHMSFRDAFGITHDYAEVADCHNSTIVAWVCALLLSAQKR